MVAYCVYLNHKSSGKFTFNALEVSLLAANLLGLCQVASLRPKALATQRHFSTASKEEKQEVEVKAQAVAQVKDDNDESEKIKENTEARPTEKQQVEMNLRMVNAAKNQEEDTKEASDESEKIRESTEAPSTERQKMEMNPRMVNAAINQEQDTQDESEEIVLVVSQTGKPQIDSGSSEVQQHGLAPCSVSSQVQVSAVSPPSRGYEPSDSEKIKIKVKTEVQPIQLGQEDINSLVNEVPHEVLSAPEAP
jgi:hypothetical protein